MTVRIDTAPKLKIQTNGRYEMETMHLMDTEAEEEAALCKAEVSGHDLTGLGNCMDRRKDDLPVGTVCEPCKALAVQWAANRLLKLEAGVRDLVAGAEKLGTMASDCLKNSENHRRQAADAEIEAARYRIGAERKESKTYELEEEAREYRQLLHSVARETGLDVQRL